MRLNERREQCCMFTPHVGMSCVVYSGDFEPEDPSNLSERHDVEAERGTPERRISIVGHVFLTTFTPTSTSTSTSTPLPHSVRGTRP